MKSQKSQLLKVDDQDCHIYVQIVQENQNQNVYYLNLWQQNSSSRLLQTIQVDYYQNYCWSTNSSHLVILTKDDIIVYETLSLDQFSKLWKERFRFRPVKSLQVVDLQCSFPVLFARTLEEAYAINICHSYYHVFTKDEIDLTLSDSLVSSLSFDGKFLSTYQNERLRVFSLDILLLPGAIVNTDELKPLLQDNLNQLDLKSTDLSVESSDPIVDLVWRRTHFLQGMQLLLVTFLSGKVQVYEIFYQQELEDDAIVAIALNAAISAGVMSRNDRGALPALPAPPEPSLSVVYFPTMRLVSEILLDDILRPADENNPVDTADNDQTVKVVKALWLNGLFPALSSTYLGNKGDVTDVLSKASTSANAMFGMSVKKRKTNNDDNHLWLLLQINDGSLAGDKLLVLDLNQDVSLTGLIEAQLTVSKKYVIAIKNVISNVRVTTDVLHAIGIYSTERGSPTHIKLFTSNVLRFDSKSGEDIILPLLTQHFLDLTMKHDDQNCLLSKGESTILNTLFPWQTSSVPFSNFSWTVLENFFLIVAKQIESNGQFTRELVLLTDLKGTDKIRVLDVRPLSLKKNPDTLVILARDSAGISVSLSGIACAFIPPLSADTIDEEPEIDGGHHDFYSVEIIPDLHFGLGIRLDESPVNNNPSDGVKVTVSSFKPHPVTKEPMAAELSGLIHPGDELIAINETIFYRRSLAEVIPTVRNLLSSILPDQTVKLRFLRSNATAKTNADLEHFIKDHEKKELSQAISQRTLVTEILQHELIPVSNSSPLSRAVMERERGYELISFDITESSFSAHHQYFIFACVMKKAGKIWLRFYEMSLKYHTNLPAKHTTIHWESLQTKLICYTQLKLKLSQLEVHFQSAGDLSLLYNVLVLDRDFGRQKRFKIFQYQGNIAESLSWRILAEKSEKISSSSQYGQKEIQISPFIIALRSYAHLRDNASAYHIPDGSTVSQREDENRLSNRHSPQLLKKSPYLSVLLSPYLMSCFSLNKKGFPFHDFIKELIKFRPSTTSNILSINFKDANTLLHLSQENIIYKLSKYFLSKLSSILSESAIQFTLQVVYEMSTRYQFISSSSSHSSSLLPPNSLMIGDQIFTSVAVFYLHLLTTSVSDLISLAISADIPDTLETVLEEFRVKDETSFTPANSPRPLVSNQSKKNAEVKNSPKKDFDDGFDPIENSDDENPTDECEEMTLDPLMVSIYNNQHYEIHLLSRLSSLVMNLFTSRHHNHRFQYHYSMNALWHIQYQKSWITMIREAASNLLKLKPDIFGKVSNGQNDLSDEEGAIDYSLDKSGKKKGQQEIGVEPRPLQWNDLPMSDVANLFFSPNQAEWFQIFFAPITIQLEDSQSMMTPTDNINSTTALPKTSSNSTDQNQDKEKERSNLMLSLGCSLIFNSSPSDLSATDILRLDLLTYMSSLKISFWVHDLQSILPILYKHSMKKYRLNKSSMKIFLEMVIVGKVDTLINIAKVDSSPSGKQLLTLLIMVDEAFNPYNTDKDKLTKLQNTLRKNAFALIRKQLYREAAAVFLLCPTVAMIRSAQSVLAHQHRSPFLAHLVSRLVETRLALGKMNHNLNQSSSKDSSSTSLSFLSDSSNSSHSNHHLSNSSITADALFDNTQPLLDRSSYVLGVFSSEIVKKDILPGLLNAAKSTIEEEKYNFPDEGKNVILIDDHRPIHLASIGYHGMKDFSAILLAMICALWLQEEEVLASTFDALLPLLTRYIDKVTDTKVFEGKPTTQTNIITLSERWEMIILFKHSFQHQYKLNHLYLLLQFLESTFTASSTSNPSHASSSSVLPASFYHSHQMTKIVHSLSFFLDASCFLSKEYIGKMMVLVNHILSSYHLSAEQLQLHLYYQSLADQPGTEKGKKSKHLHINAFYRYAKNHYQKMVSQMNRSSLIDTKFIKQQSLRPQEDSKEANNPKEDSENANKPKFNFASFASRPSSATTSISFHNTNLGKTDPGKSSSATPSILDMDFSAPTSRVPQRSFESTEKEPKSALDMFDVMPVRRSVKQESEKKEEVKGNDSWKNVTDPFSAAGKSALDAFDFQPPSRTTSAKQNKSGEASIKHEAAKAVNPSPPSALDDFDHTNYTRPNRSSNSPKFNPTNEVKESTQAPPSALDMFDQANYQRSPKHSQITVKKDSDESLLREVALREGVENNTVLASTSKPVQDYKPDINLKKEEQKPLNTSVVHEKKELLEESKIEKREIPAENEEVTTLDPPSSTDEKLMKAATVQPDNKLEEANNAALQSKSIQSADTQPLLSKNSVEVKPSTIHPSSVSNTAAKPLSATHPPPSLGLNPPKSKSVEQRVRMFYERYNPSKISSIPSILEKYKGKEQELLEKLRKQYNAEDI